MNSHNDPFVNPFRQFRAEQFDENLWAYYVPRPFENLLGPKPLIVEGGRGSGKTMFFLCSSWREQRYALKPKEDSLKELLGAKQRVGLYYRVDTPFVTALCGDDLTSARWSGIFATYFGTCILRELVDFLSECEHSVIVTESELRPTFLRIGTILKAETLPETLGGVRGLLAQTLDHIEQVANNPTGEIAVSGTIPGRLVSETIAALRIVPAFAETHFHIFVDEYESLLEYQQRQINTLIKHSVALQVYNIGLRPNGMRTPLTSADSEQIQEPHDFRHFRPEMALSVQGSDSTEFQSILVEICRKRFENASTIAPGLDPKWLDISEYLGSYEVEDELASFADADAAPVIARLEVLIRESVKGPEEQKRFLRILGTEAPLPNARLHVCLLLRRAQFRPKVAALAEEFEKWRIDRASSKRYSDWWHNTKVALAFLMAHECRQPKRYSGMDVYAMLSSGIIRYFIELCEQAFDFAHEKGFSWSKPRPLTHDEQTKAARFVSKYKVNDLQRLPSGARLRQLTMSLGTIFQELHRHHNSTLGEPERNHFSIAADELSSESSGLRDLLSAAMLWAVLQQHGPASTKDKDAEKKADAVDFHLNHIYCPYFEISYRQKRKIELSVAQVSALSGLEPMAVRTTVKGIIAKLTDETPSESPQLLLPGGG